MYVSKCCGQSPLYDVDKKGFGICSWCKKPSKFKKKEKKKPAKIVKKDKKMSNCFFPKISFFQKVENWLQNKAYWLNIIFAVLFGVSLALNVFQYKVIQFYKKIQETIIINGGF